MKSEKNKQKNPKTFAKKVLSGYYCMCKPYKAHKRSGCDMQIKNEEEHLVTEEEIKLIKK